MKRLTDNALNGVIGGDTWTSVTNNGGDTVVIKTSVIDKIIDKGNHPNFTNRIDCVEPPDDPE